MKRIPAAILVSALFAGSALAAERTVTLKVENMTCDLCAPTVKKSLARIKGVIRVEVSAEKATATVTFDDASTDTAALTTATKNAGYPSHFVPQ